MKCYWAVWGNSDMTEGRGMDEIKCVCSTHELAVELSKKASTMGSPGSIKPFYVLDKKEDQYAKPEERAKLSGLSKLTPEEINALLGGVR